MGRAWDICRVISFEEARWIGESGRRKGKEAHDERKGEEGG